MTNIPRTYEIADTDELEAFGRDTVDVDTSAGIGPDEAVRQEEYEKAESSARSHRRMFLALFVIALAVGATVVGVLLSRRSGKAKGDAENDVGSNGNSSDGESGANTGGTSSPNAVGSTAPDANVRVFNVGVEKRFRHDQMAFTQGFEYADGVFYESTGLRGRSTLRKVEIGTGKVLQQYEFSDSSLFGEGITLHKDHHIFMLTWQAGRGFVFNQSTFEVIKEWSYHGEGWGLCMDRGKDEVYMSDGTDILRVLEPEDLKQKRNISVTLRGKKVSELNELEWICGEVWANVWRTSKIYRIDPTTGVVKSIIDASNLPLKKDRVRGIDVLNGIAFDRETGRLWLTGKLWPAVYQVNVTDESLDFSKCT